MSDSLDSLAAQLEIGPDGELSDEALEGVAGGFGDIAALMVATGMQAHQTGLGIIAAQGAGPQATGSEKRSQSEIMQQLMAQTAAIRQQRSGLAP
jgi:hypothetical protein